MALIRTFNSDWLNGIVNHREVIDWVRGPLEAPLDLSAAVANPDNVVLATALGGFFFHKIDDYRYEVHTQFLPAGRAGVLGLAREAADYMFSATKCERIQTHVPESNIGAKRLTEAVGFQHQGVDGTWPVRGREVPNHFYELTKEAWTRKNN